MALIQLPQPTDDGAISIVGLLNTFLRKRSLIALCALAGVALAVVPSLVRHRTYTSSTSFLPQNQRPASSISGLAAQFGISVADQQGSESPTFYMDLLGSHSLLGAVVDSKFTMRDRGKTRQGNLVQLYDIRKSTPPLSREAAITELRKHINAGVSKITGVVTLSVNAKDPELARAITGQMLAFVHQFNVERRQNQAAAERNFAEARLRDVGGELRAAEDRLQEFLSGNRIVNSPQLRFEQDRLERKVGQEQQLYNAIAQAYEQAGIEAMRNTPVVTVVEEPQLPVRPDSRRLATHAIPGLIVGALLGMVLALILAAGERMRLEGMPEALEFEQLKHDAVADLKHPWRPIARAFKRTSPPQPGIR